MVFLSMVPCDYGFIVDVNNSIPLRIVKDDAVEVTPNLGLTVSDLNNGYKHFFNSGGIGVTFKVNIILYKNDTISLQTTSGGVNSINVITLLDTIIRNNIPVYVYTEAVDIPKDKYIIKNNPKRKQSAKGVTIWELEFITYTPINVVKYANNNVSVQKAIKEAKEKKSIKYPDLKKCNYKQLKYTKKKKVTKCVKTLQKVLYKMKVLDKKHIDGWYGKSTKTAVKKYQKRYNKNHTVTVVSQNTSSLMKVSAGKLVSGGEFATVSSNAKLNTTVNPNKKKITKKLKVTGKIDKATWIALYKGEK